jgi:antitoxin (DNA-binding transcriptional repressor) of toxin-antitoxin stability system
MSRSAKFPALRRGGEALVYTMRDLGQHLARIMGEVEATGKTAFITKHGRFVAIITPLVPGQVESRVLGEMAHEIGKRARD